MAATTRGARSAHRSHSIELANARESILPGLSHHVFNAGINRARDIFVRGNRLPAVCSHHRDTGADLWVDIHA